MAVRTGWHRTTCRVVMMFSPECVYQTPNESMCKRPRPVHCCTFAIQVGSSLDPILVTLRHGRPTGDSVILARAGVDAHQAPGMAQGWFPIDGHRCGLVVDAQSDVRNAEPRCENPYS